MLQQHVAALPRPDLDESRSLQLAAHLGPGHLVIVNLALGYVKGARGRLESFAVRFLPADASSRRVELLIALDGRVVSQTFASWNRISNLLR
jgi:hypothetical protein